MSGADRVEVDPDPGEDLEAPASMIGGRDRYRPGQHRNIARSVYGLVLAMSVLAVYSNDPSADALEAAVTLVTTSAVFWVAHVYAEDLATRIERGRSATWPERRVMFAREWPIVEATGLPLVPLILAIIGVLHDHRAIDVALYVGLAEMAFLGFVAARRSGGKLPMRIASAAFSLSLGVVIVLLKTLLH